MRPLLDRLADLAVAIVVTAFGWLAIALWALSIGCDGQSEGLSMGAYDDISLSQLDLEADLGAPLKVAEPTLVQRSVSDSGARIFTVGITVSSESGSDPPSLARIRLNWGVKPAEKRELVFNVGSVRNGIRDGYQAHAAVSLPANWIRVSAMNEGSSYIEGTSSAMYGTDVGWQSPIRVQGWIAEGDLATPGPLVRLARYSTEDNRLAAGTSRYVSVPIGARIARLFYTPRAAPAGVVGDFRMAWRRDAGTAPEFTASAFGAPFDVPTRAYGLTIRNAGVGDGSYVDVEYEVSL